MDFLDFIDCVVEIFVQGNLKTNNSDLFEHYQLHGIISSVCELKIIISSSQCSQQPLPKSSLST